MMGVTSGPAAMSPREYMQETRSGPPNNKAMLQRPIRILVSPPSVGHLLVLIRYNQPNRRV